MRFDIVSKFLSIMEGTVVHSADLFSVYSYSVRTS